MNTVYILLLIALFSNLIQAQYKSSFDKKMSLNEYAWVTPQFSHLEFNRYADSVSSANTPVRVDSINSVLKDTLKFNMYGDLRDDDPLYNPKSSLGMVALRVTLANITTNLVDRFIFNYDYSRVGFNSWSHNIKTGWEWDVDRFAMNNFFHPFSGGMSFNAARANGYSFFESVPFAALGSLEWEYFGETTLPSYNDIINTTINGAFLGEIFYRLGSNILDDQTSGADRFFREMAVAIITPTRFFSRLLHGELTRTTPGDVYQKEPLNITLAAAYHRVNGGSTFLAGSNSASFNMMLDYGNPFEKRERKPFDYFKLRTDIDVGGGRKIIDNLNGYGNLFASNLQYGNMEILTGLFQHMNFFDNNTLELATLAFGPGIISKLPITKSLSLYTDLHLNVVPFGSLSGRIVTDTSEFRDYDYAGGANLRFETTFNIGGWVGVSLSAFYWWFHTYVGVAGNSYIGIIKPRIAFKIFNNVSLGFEQTVYYNDRYPTKFKSTHDVNTEQKVFVQIFLEEFKFKR